MLRLLAALAGFAAQLWFGRQLQGAHIDPAVHARRSPALCGERTGRDALLLEISIRAGRTPLEVGARSHAADGETSRVNGRSHAADGETSRVNGRSTAPSPAALRLQGCRPRPR